MAHYQIYKKIGLVAGPIVFLLLYNLPFVLLTPTADKVIAIASWMIIWWITEPVSISVTALIPLAFFPLLGIMDMKSAAAHYGSPIVFLFFGGFVIALALEKVMLHKRIALNIIKVTGTSPNRVVLGFMIATASLSMWISNTASTVVMLPIALSVITLLIDDEDGFTKNDQNFALSIMLGIAFSANVGGIATIIGTPPNVVLVGFMENEYNVNISFLKWMMMGLPFTIIMLTVIYFVIVKWLYPNNLVKFKASAQLIDKEIDKLGPINATERRVLIIFFVTIFLWVFRSVINPYFPAIHLSDAGISMLAAFALFAIPFKFNTGEFTLKWIDTQKLPWGILILFGGGLALASGLSQVGIIDMIGDAVSQNKSLSLFGVSILLIVIILFMTELMSNVAIVAIFAPVIAGIAMGLDTSILHLLIPTTMAASCAFMLPMATPPNAIVFASGHIKVHEMARVGFALNFIAILLLILYSRFVIPYIF
jgi:sodium-dependent dicarboxylate transporter 2/3/5